MIKKAKKNVHGFVNISSLNFNHQVTIFRFLDEL